MLGLYFINFGILGVWHSSQNRLRRSRSRSRSRRPCRAVVLRSSTVPRVAGAPEQRPAPEAVPRVVPPRVVPPRFAPAAKQAPAPAAPKQAPAPAAPKQAPAPAAKQAPAPAPQQAPAPAPQQAPAPAPQQAAAGAATPAAWPVNSSQILDLIFEVIKLSV